MTGLVFSMVTLAVLVVLSPSESVAVATQLMLSPTLQSFANTVYEAVLPTEVFPLNHS